MRDFIVDQSYLNNLNIPLIAGSNFPLEASENKEQFILINKNALKEFGVKNAPDAIGRVVYVGDDVPLEIIGVMGNFHYRPLSYEIGPMAFRMNSDLLSIISIRINPQSDIEQVMTLVEMKWNEVDPDHPLLWGTMSSEIDGAYSTSGMLDIIKILGYISFLAISLACLGLLGMVMFVVQTRLKEIGIRKVLGASPVSIISVLSKSFGILFLIALLIGVPIATYAGWFFLSFYAYKVNPEPLLIIMVIVSLAMVGFSTIGYHTVRAALASPVRWLRYE